MPGVSRLGQRVMVKSRFVRMRAIGAKHLAMAHLAYVARDGVGIDGQESMPISSSGALGDDELDQFAARAASTRHQFRFIVSPEHGAELDLDAYTHGLVATMEKDLGTRLDWVAVAHHDTDNPHVHLTINGTTDRGDDLVISRDYLSLGMRLRASELASRELGLRAEHELVREQDREVTAERLTGIDRQLLRLGMNSPRGEIDLRQVPGPGHVDAVRRRGLQLGRLDALERLGLADEVAPGIWRLDADLVPCLQALSRRGDIIRTMHARAREIGSREQAPGLDASALDDKGHGMHTVLGADDLPGELARSDARSNAGRRLEGRLGEYVGLGEAKRFTGVVDHVMQVQGERHVVVRSGARFTLAPLGDTQVDPAHLPGRTVALEVTLEQGRRITRMQLLMLDLSQQRDLSLGL